MKQIVVISTILLLVGCEKEPIMSFKIHKGTFGYNGEEDWQPCIILTSDDFWVDSFSLCKLIELNGATIILANPKEVAFTINVNTDFDEFIEKIEAQITQWAKINQEYNKKLNP